ncbi:BLUF domain-containing protein [Marinibactrum halimedae]|uniref:BLUF domain-containing protein n=1 Tax=Marinibactrum halimedae TaxID=1444977 RepID=A0AA37T8R1_9GAMM|nr:BLUF domain-containing protein [Marinibactrum halimedae]MCD9458369.1 BLUF domain-containing protein [Marinibactrum halimedae]GLS26066.1 hypothetical protein GCM10007877_17810 [Marinibactrum halimedae]
MLHHIVYISTAVRLMSFPELVELLDQARNKNEVLSISGLLLYKDRSFIQLIEGPSDSVRSLFTSIERDLRHTHVKILIDEPLEKRMFGDWSMGFVNVDNEVKDNPGFKDYFSGQESISTMGAEPTKALRLLQYFRSRS